MELQEYEVKVTLRRCINWIFWSCNMTKLKKRVNFVTLTAVMFQVEVFWVVTPCSVVVGYLKMGATWTSETLVSCC